MGRASPHRLAGCRGACRRRHPSRVPSLAHLCARRWPRFGRWLARVPWADNVGPHVGQQPGGRPRAPGQAPRHVKACLLTPRLRAERHLAGVFWRRVVPGQPCRDLGRLLWLRAELERERRGDRRMGRLDDKPRRRVAEGVRVVFAQAAAGLLLLGAQPDEQGHRRAAAERLDNHEPCEAGAAAAADVVRTLLGPHSRRGEGSRHRPLTQC
mmetsp:Transcript_31696/g.93426  ORF Transcript_31696/g.93426 Transcript_31696/m.93426 type:complete len:211 (+) Transcript_31696:692-1324(+)